MSDKEKDILKKIAAGLPHLSEFDKGYFLGIVEAKAGAKTEEKSMERDEALAGVGGR